MIINKNTAFIKDNTIQEDNILNFTETNPTNDLQAVLSAISKWKNLVKERNQIIDDYSNINSYFGNATVVQTSGTVVNASAARIAIQRTHPYNETKYRFMAEITCNFTPSYYSSYTLNFNFIFNGKTFKPTVDAFVVYGNNFLPRGTYSSIAASSQTITKLFVSGYGTF